MKLKKLILAAAFMCASATTFAATYAVWPAATEGETQIPNEFNYWWNFSYEETDGAIKCHATDNGAACSAGWMTTAASGFDFAQLAGLDLTFNAKIEGSGKWNIRITAADGVESDATVSIPADGQFHKLRFNISEIWPAVAAKWQAGGANGRDIFTFAVVGSDLSNDAAFYFSGVRYADAVIQPSLTAEVADLTATSARLTWNAVFPEGYTDTEVTVNGEPVNGSELVLTDLSPKTAYSYTIVASGKFGGEVYTATKVVEFTTQREAGVNPVWYGSTDIPGFSAEYSITYNSDGTLTVEAEIETEKETPVADRNFHIYIGGDEWLKLYDNGNGVLTGTTASKFADGATITWEWYLPYTGGVYKETNTYVVGSENEAPLAVKVKAEARNISSDSAEISYTVTAPEGAAYKVFYKAADGDAVEATENPIKLAGLAEHTDYSFEIYAVVGEGAGAIESRHVTVAFKTTVKDAVEHVYADIFNAEFKNAWLVGEDPSMRRSIFAALPWSIVYGTDGSAVYSIDLSSVSNIVGMVPQVWSHGHNNLVKNDESGRYEYNFGAKELDAATAVSHFIAYDGGVVDRATDYTVWGMEKEAPELGEAVELVLSASKTMVKINEPSILSVVGKDANGYYRPTGEVSYSVNVDGWTLDGVVFTIVKEKGPRTITAVAGELEASIVVNAFASEEAENLIAGKIGVTDEDYIKGGAIANVTDANLESQLEWNCAETAEHYLVYDLGADYYIEGVEVLFENAYATKFTVTLSAEAPAELGANGASTFAASDDKVFENTKNDIKHCFTQDPEGTHRYVALRTSEALNNSWGIKVRDLKVHGSEAKPTSTTGVDEIVIDNSDDNAPVEYYNLNGQRVINPAAGLYIRRQGNAVTKVLVK